MQGLRVQGFSISVDGYGACPNQSLENICWQASICLRSAMSAPSKPPATKPRTSLSRSARSGSRPAGGLLPQGAAADQHDVELARLQHLAESV
jgi:hypothetical protein